MASEYMDRRRIRYEDGCVTEPQSHVPDTQLKCHGFARWLMNYVMVSCHTQRNSQNTIIHRTKGFRLAPLDFQIFLAKIQHTIP